MKVPKTRCEQTQREAALLPRLSHPNIVKLLEVIETPNGPACVYAEAVSDLLEFVNEGLSEAQVKVIARAVLKATKYLHDHSILHRDIKPENILVESLPVEEKSIVLNDFGLAREEPEGIVEDEFCGSPHYAAPEIWRQEPYSNEVDMWAIGILLWACLTRSLPMPVEVAEAGKAVLAGLPEVQETEEVEGVSEEALELLRGLLDPNPLRRMTAEEALESPWLAEEDDEESVAVKAARVEEVTGFDCDAEEERFDFQGFEAAKEGGRDWLPEEQGKLRALDLAERRVEEEVQGRDFESRYYVPEHAVML